MEKRYPAEPGFPIAFTDRIKPKVQGKKVFLSTSFHDEHKPARKILKIGISEYILSRSISQREFELMEPKYCFDAEDMQGPEKLRDRAKYGLSKADYSIFDVSSRRASVFFELGIAQALCKPWWMVWHCTSFNPLDTSFLPDFLKQPLITDFRITQPGNISRKDEFCRKVLGSLMESEKAEQFSPNPLEVLGREVILQPNSFYFTHSAKSYWDPIHREVESYLERIGLTKVTLPRDLIGKDEWIKICCSIKSASVCLIDTTGQDCGFYYILGYGYGQEGERIVINLHQDNEDPIFMWEGMPDIPWHIQRMTQDIITGLEKHIPKEMKGKGLEATGN